jgi:hypothetical protein
MKGLKKLEGQHRGPYKIISTDSHNNVLVDMDGTEEKFSVETCEKAHTLNPKDRFPPQYKQGLRYDPLEQPNQEEQASEENKEQGSRHAQSLRSNKRKQETNKNPKKKMKSESKKQQPAMTRGREKLFAIIKDQILSQYHAAQLIQEEGIQKAHLYMKAKRGKYHPVWFDPKDLSDPPKSKSQPSKPKGWEPWIVIPEQDETWKIVQPITTNLKSLDHKLIK